MHATKPLRDVGREKLPFAGCSAVCAGQPYVLAAFRSLTSLGYEGSGSGRSRIPNPEPTFAGGHRSRVTPVPIPNTEVKPATADGTAWETVWESRSLPALSRSPR